MFDMANKLLAVSLIYKGEREFLDRLEGIRRWLLSDLVSPPPSFGTNFEGKVEEALSVIADLKSMIERALNPMLMTVCLRQLTSETVVKFKEDRSRMEEKQQRLCTLIDDLYALTSGNGIPPRIMLDLRDLDLNLEPKGPDSSNP